MQCWRERNRPRETARPVCEPPSNSRMFQQLHTQTQNCGVWVAPVPVPGQPAWQVCHTREQRPGRLCTSLRCGQHLQESSHTVVQIHCADDTYCEHSALIKATLSVQHHTFTSYITRQMSHTCIDKMSHNCYLSTNPPDAKK